MKEVLYEGVNLGEKDFSALVSKIKASGADLVYWGGLHTEGGLLVRQMRDQGVKAPLMGGDGIASDEFAAIGGPGVEGTLMTFAPDPRKNGPRPRPWWPVRGQEVQPRGLYALHLRGPEVIAQAAADAKSLDPKKVRPRSQSGKTFKTVIGDLKLRQEGRHHAARLRDVHLEEGRRRQDHLRPELIRRQAP